MALINEALEERKHTRVIPWHQQALEQAILQIDRLAQPCVDANYFTSKEERQSTTHQVVLHVQAIGAWLRNTVEPSLVEEVYEDALRPAHHLFDLHELVGRILSHVSLCDLRRASEVNQLFRKVVDGSPYLQQAMFLRSYPKSDFASVLESTEYCKHCRVPWFNLYDCLDCTRMIAILKVENKPRRPGFRSLRVTITYGGSEEAAKKLTPRTQSLLAFQPPVRTVDISTSCCNDPLHRGLAKGLTLESVVQANTILLPEVLTIGVLVDLTLSFKKQHSSCSTAEPCTVGVSAHVFL